MSEKEEKVDSPTIGVTEIDVSATEPSSKKVIEAQVVEGNSQISDAQPAAKPFDTPSGRDVDVIEWPFTKGDIAMTLKDFDVANIPNCVADEKNDTGRIILALFAEIIELTGRINMLTNEVSELSFDKWMDEKKMGGGKRSPSSFSRR